METTRCDVSQTRMLCCGVVNTLVSWFAPVLRVVGSGEPSTEAGRVRYSRTISRLAALLGRASAVTALATALPVAAQAPEWNGGGFIAVNAGLQARTRSFPDEAVFPVSAGVNTDALSGFAAGEPATVDSTYGFRTGGLFDVGGSAHVWNNIGLGGSVSRFTHQAAAAVSAQVLHPLFFYRFRNISGESPLLARSEIDEPAPSRPSTTGFSRSSAGLFQTREGPRARGSTGQTSPSGCEVRPPSSSRSTETTWRAWRG